MSAATSERAAAIVAAYRELGTLQAVGERFGITREGVRQVILRHEHATGEAVPRTGGALRSAGGRVIWRCHDCGVTREIWKSAARMRVCNKCKGKYVGARSRKYLSDALIAGAIAKRLRGERFHPIALAAGYSVTSTHQLPAAIYRHLLRQRDAETIARIWPRGVPHWLVRRFGAPPPSAAA